MNVITRRNMSVITMLVPRHRASEIVNDLFADGIPSAMLSGARGTLVKDKWYQTLLPMISPELEMVQMITPDPEVDEVMERAVRHAHLYRSGSGAIFCTPCDDLHAKGDVALWPLGRPENANEDASTDLHENLSAIYYISQGTRTDAVCRAALGAGTHGPIVQYARGVGIRERLGWLRITSKPIKEVVSVLVDNVDADFVFAAMAEAGQVNRAGHGVIYRVPIQKGLVNIGSVYAGTRHSASIQQIIRAVDELKGNKDWRDQTLIDVQGGQAAGLDFVDALTRTESPESQSRLSLIVDRDAAQSITEHAMDGGAPGVNINYLQLHQAANGTDEKQHRELAHLRMILNTDHALSLGQQLLDAHDLNMMVFTQPITRALSYSANIQANNAARNERAQAL